MYHRTDVGKRIYLTCCITEKMWESASIRPVVLQKRCGKAYLSDLLYHRKDVGKRIYLTCCITEKMWEALHSNNPVHVY